jgi:hypothetical protein
MEDTARGYAGLREEEQEEEVAAAAARGRNGHAHTSSCMDCVTLPVPLWLFALINALFALWYGPTANSPRIGWPGDDPQVYVQTSAADTDCTEREAGRIVFNPVSRHFQGCDGHAWSQLAFCCAPARPAPPRMSAQAVGCELSLSWSPPAAHGSPVSEYSLAMHTADDAAAEGRTIYRGPSLSFCVGAVSSPGVHFTVTAHAVGGDSAPSDAVELQAAPSPVLLEVLDDGSCDFGHADVLRVHFDRPTSQPGAPSISNASGSAADGGYGVPPSQVRRLLRFSSPVGELVGRWAAPEILELKLRPGTQAPAVDPLLQRLNVSINGDGGVVVAPPALSKPATGTSPPLHVPGCFLEGFEAARLAADWVIESEDVSAYSVTFDREVTHSGRHSLKLEGGSSINFDGLRGQLPAGSRPRQVSFWLRTSSRANAGYFTLGGNTILSSVLFFHLRADGSAGLLSSTGAWQSGRYQKDQWLHVRIDIEWPYRRADLWLDGSRTASAVAFASSTAADNVDEIHLFSFDRGTVWWDDLVIQLEDEPHGAPQKQEGDGTST